MKCIKITIITLMCVLLFCGCRHKEETTSALNLTCDELRKVFAEYDCERYDVDVAVYGWQRKEISIDVYYNEAYSTKKISDLLDLKEVAEKYRKENQECFSEIDFSLVCYLLEDKDYDIPKEYIFFDISSSGDINLMKINAQCDYEQFKGLMIGDVQKLEIDYEFTKSFDCEILTCFPNLTDLTIPSCLCYSDEYVKSIIPESCNINYTDGSSEITWRT